MNLLGTNYIDNKKNLSTEHAGLCMVTKGVQVSQQIPKRQLLVKILFSPFAAKRTLQPREKENLVAFRLQVSISVFAATFVYPNPGSDERSPISNAAVVLLHWIA